MSTLANRYFTPEEYLKLEREAPYKSEYYDGVIYAMAGAREARDLIAGNTYYHLRNGFTSQNCRAHTSDMKVRTTVRHYVYPDLSAFCGEPQFLDGTPDVLLNPSVIVEVLSPSTEAYDRAKKSELYRSPASLREYLLLSSDRVHADLDTRRSDGQWMLTSFDRPEDELVIGSIGCRLRIADLYEYVNFDALS